MLLHAALLVNLLACVEPVSAPRSAPSGGAPLFTARGAAAPDARAESGIPDLVARGVLRPRFASTFADIEPSAPVSHLNQGETIDFAELGPPLENLEVDMERGAALADYVDANIKKSNWNTYGVASLTYEEVWAGDGGSPLCEEGALTDTFKVDGSKYEASYAMGQYAHVIGDFQYDPLNLSDDCVAALAEHGADVGAAVGDGCDEYDEHTLFPAGGECRACLESSAGDWAACVTAESCEDGLPVQAWIGYEGKEYWGTLAIGLIWACAPDLPVPGYFVGNFGADGSLPTPYAHDELIGVCTPYWDDSAGEPVYYCSTGTNGPMFGHAMGYGGVGRLNYLRPEGETLALNTGRLWYASSLEIKGTGTIGTYWATTPGSGQISQPRHYSDGAGNPAPWLEGEPLGVAYAAWGLNPLELRPGGTDPTDIDDTWARQWLATLALKTATTIDGVPIATYNANRCAEDGWEGPYADGRYHCHTLEAPTAVGHSDGGTFTFSSIGSGEGAFDQLYYMPMATIASTGLPDPNVPGGNTVLIAGTAALANDDWDGCSWPTTFVPDVLDLSATYEDRDRSYLLGDTWRFGAHDELDLAVVLNTNQTRGFCPPETQATY